MTYTITITSAEHHVRMTRDHIVDALDVVLNLTKGRVNAVHLVTDVAQLGDYLDCVNGVWIRVTRETLH